MQSANQLIDDPYYRDNLYSLLIAMEDMGGAPNTGDWFGELIYFLERHGADKNKGNVTLNELKLFIYQAVTSRPLLDMLSMVDPSSEEGAT